MKGFESVVLQKVVVHRVGNPTRGEELKLSANPLSLNDTDVQKLLSHYFLAGLNENEKFRFTHLSDLAMNEVYAYACTLFDEPALFMQQAALIAHFLYTKSTHVKVKEGELYVAQLSNLLFEGEEVSALGLFKSESKETFLKVFEHGKSYELVQEQGINIQKPDKGALIIRKNREEGFVVLVADNTNRQQDAQYWVNDFLQVTPYSDSYHQTDKYLSLCRQFITQEYPENFEVTKSDQIELLNRSMDYFKTREQFNLQEFADEVIHHPEVKETFFEYRKQFEKAKDVEIADAFDIHLAAVKKQQRVFKSVLKLDRNFHIYIHGRRDLIEKGYDETTGKHFYKIYFDEEH